MANLTSKQWLDLVFEGKNKDFGAYKLREKSAKRHNLAVLFTLIGLIVVAAVVFGIAKYNDYREQQRQAELLAEAERMAALAAMEEENTPDEEIIEESKIEIEIPEVPEDVLETVQQTAVAIVDEVKNEARSADEALADNTHVGVVTQEGKDDADQFQAVKEQVKVVEEPKPEPKHEPEQIFQAVEQQAQFPGGQAALNKWLSNNLRYPEAAQQNDIQGKVIVRFVVEKDGSVSQATVLKGVDRDLDKEALRVVNKMPKWQPGKNNGVAVRSYFTLPVVFKLQNQ